MGTLPDFRTALRLDLNDPAAAAQRFSDSDLDRAITRAAADLTLISPKETDTEHTILAPPRPTPFYLTLLVDDVPAANTITRLRWTNPHSITVATTTVPSELDLLIAQGAAGYASLAYSTPSADNFKYDDGATVAAVDDSM